MAVTGVSKNMNISRELALIILKFLRDNPLFDFPYIIMCKEYTIEDEDFVEIEPDEFENINEDIVYQSFILSPSSWVDETFGYKINRILAPKYLAELLFCSLISSNKDEKANQVNNLLTYSRLYKNFKLHR